MLAVLKVESIAVPSKLCSKLSTIKARMGDISIPPIAGINPRNAFR